MARRVEAFPAKPDQSKYPWDEWLDGSIWELTQGEDFKGRANTFRSNARSQAKKRDGTLTARIVKAASPDEGDKVYIQYTRS